MKVAAHVIAERRTRLAEALQQTGYLPVSEVCRRFAVSEATARRDLAALAGTQIITRTRGGALADYDRGFPSFRERLDQAGDEKRRIAAAARRLVRPGMTIWCDGGTTVHAFVHALVDQPVDGVTIVTNSLPVAGECLHREAVTVELVGGRVFPRSGLIMAQPEAMLVGRRFDLAMLGIEGLTREGLWNSQEDVAALQRAVNAIAHQTIVLADATKVGKGAPARVGGWPMCSLLITSAPMAALNAHFIPRTEVRTDHV